MKKGTVFLLILGGLLLPAGCRTTEENYREAYEKTIAARQQQDSLDATIYGRERRMRQPRTVSTPSGDVQVTAQLVKVTKDGGGIPQNLRRFNVVVGQFRQLFNAKSLRERLVDMGYSTAFVVETGEPYYYIVLASYNDAADAQKSLDAFRKAAPIPMKDPLPFILDATARRQPVDQKK